MPEIKLPPSRAMDMSMPSEHEELMQQHLRDENLPEVVMPAMPVNKVLKGQKALVWTQPAPASLKAERADDGVLVAALIQLS